MAYHTIILVIKGLTLKTPRETISCPAALFLLVPLLGIWDVDGLARRHICKPRSVLFKTSKIFLEDRSHTADYIIILVTLLTVSGRGIEIK